MAYKPTIGLEIHIELNTNSKMFCSCKNDPDERKANTNICPVCTAQPGTLPVINEEAVRKVIKTGLALNCQISEHSKFDRKNYFYPDLPKGYQISQYDMPFCKEGYLDIEGQKIIIRRVHLEEDTGKLIHPEGTDHSLVDFNRAGIPLMELVTEPDITSAKEAREFAQELHLIMHYLDISDADMEKGQMRVEVNISLSKKEGELGTKVEIKNLNSFRSVERGIEYEIKRQTELLEKGEKIIQETRGWEDKKEITISQREKEEAHDYRYFPEPDLPPLHFTKKEIEEIRAEIPELPQQKRERFKKEYQLDEKSIEFFVYNKDLGEFFKKVITNLISKLPPNLPKENILKLIKYTADCIINNLQGKLKGTSTTTNNSLITPEDFAEYIILTYPYPAEIQKSEPIGPQYPSGPTGPQGRVILEEMFKTGAAPSKIIKEKGLEQISDAGELEKIIKEIIKNNPKVVEDYKKGKVASLQFLIGKVMAETKGAVNPQVANKLLQKFLK